MGRVSKRKTAGIHSEQNVKVRRYRAGIYARLSADHDERKMNQWRFRLRLQGNM